jgi:hypothetical protein
MNRRLKAVPTEPRPVDMAPDIYDAIRKKRASIDWAKMHITADRRREVFAPPPNWKAPSSCGNSNATTGNGQRR